MVSIVFGIYNNKHVHRQVMVKTSSYATEQGVGQRVLFVVVPVRRQVLEHVRNKSAVHCKGSALGGHVLERVQDGRVLDRF